MSEVSGAILIGGQARRFGCDKVVLPLPGGPLIGRSMHALAPLFPEVLLVGHQRPGLGGYPVIPDIVPGCGPLGGILTALVHSLGDHVFVFAGDMPNLDAGLIRDMISSCGEREIILPRWSAGTEPLHAIYHRRLAPRIRTLLTQGSRRIHDLLAISTILPVEEGRILSHGDPRVIFANINTPADLRFALPPACTAPRTATS